MDKRATGYGPPSRDSGDNNRTSIVRTTIMDIGAGYSSNSPYEAHLDTVSTAYNINDNMASSASRLSRITPYYPDYPHPLSSTIPALPLSAFILFDHRVEEAVDVGAFRFSLLSEESVKTVCDANGPQDHLLSDTCKMVRGAGFAHQFTSTVYSIGDELLQCSIRYKRFESGCPHQPLSPRTSSPLSWFLDSCS